VRYEHLEDKVWWRCTILYTH